MKQFIFLNALLISFSIRAEWNCNDLKSCTEWIKATSGPSYTIGKLGTRRLILNKKFGLPKDDFEFCFVLQDNNLVRLKNNGVYQIFEIKDVADSQYPKIDSAKIPETFDFYSVEFAYSVDKKINDSAVVMLKKVISKNGKVSIASGSENIVVIDDGLHLNIIKMIMDQLIGQIEMPTKKKQK